MVKILDKYEYPEGLYYSKDHMWVKVEDEKVRVGWTDVAQQSAGTIIFIRVMPKGRRVSAGRPLGTVESGKWVGPLRSPVNGIIEAVNEALKSKPSLLNEDPYGEGWIAVLQPTQLESDLKGLMYQPEEIRPWLEGELSKLFKK